MIKTFLKLLALPFVVVWRLIWGLIKLVFLTQALITTLVLLVLAAAGFVLFNSDHVISQKILGFLKNL